MFAKGSVPWNKGIKFEAGGRSVSTRFKKGTRPPNHRPVGSTRVTKDGYLEIKIEKGLHKWRLLHREIWKTHNGSYPKKSEAIVFIDGDKQNCSIENLKLVSRCDLMKMNSVQNYPENVKEVIRLKSVLRRKLNGK